MMCINGEHCPVSEHREAARREAAANRHLDRWGTVWADTGPEGNLIERVEGLEESLLLTWNATLEVCRQLLRRVTELEDRLDSRDRAEAMERGRA